MRLLSGPSLGVLIVNFWAKFIVIIWAKLISTNFSSGFCQFLDTHLSLWAMGFSPAMSQFLQKNLFWGIFLLWLHSKRVLKDLGVFRVRRQAGDRSDNLKGGWGFWAQKQNPVSQLLIFFSQFFWFCWSSNCIVLLLVVWVVAYFKEILTKQYLGPYIISGTIEKHFSGCFLCFLFVKV